MSCDVFAVAGPVESNRVVFTNRNWVIDGADLEKTLGIQRVRLVNDFVGAGYGLLTLDKHELHTLQEACTGKNWLVVLDDVWDVKHEKQLNCIDDSTTSKLFVTTRIRGLLKNSAEVRAGGCGCGLACPIALL